MESWRDDLRDSALHNAASGSSTDAKILSVEFNNMHAPICSRSITLRPHTPWFNAEHLRSLKRDNRQFEWRYVASGLEVHRQIYRKQCRRNTMR